MTKADETERRNLEDSGRRLLIHQGSTDNNDKQWKHKWVHP